MNGNSSHIVNAPTIYGTSNAPGGLSLNSEEVPDSRHANDPQQGSSETLEIHRQGSRVVTADIIPAQLFSEVQPLQQSPNRWIAPSLNNRGRADMFTPRKAKYRFTGLLNKLTGKNVGFICDKIVDWIKKCERAVQEQVFQKVIKLIFDRAILEPERMGIYVNLCVIIEPRFQLKGSSSLVIFHYLSECWSGVFQLGYLSWGDPIQEPQRTCECTIEEYYDAEKARRRGIGLAGLRVELMKIGRLTLQSTHMSNESFLVELGLKFQNNPNEGDVVSLTMFLECIKMEPSYWRGSRDYDSRIEWAPYARRLADECGNGRLKYRLLVSFSSPYDFLLITINRILQSCARNFRS